MFARNPNTLLLIIVLDGFLQDSIASIEDNHWLNNRNPFPASLKWVWILGIGKLSGGLFFAVIDISLPDEK